MIFIILILVTATVFRSWFTGGIITAGDMSFFFNEQVSEYLNVPFMWETFRNSGLGGSSFLHHGVYLYNVPFALLQKLFNYDVVQRVVWLWPLLVGGILSSYYVTKVIGIVSPRYALISPIIYMFNTYFLMIIGGGQLTVAQAYILFPLGVGLLVKVLRSRSLTDVLLFALLFSLLSIVDFRFSYMFVMVGIMYALYVLWLNFSLPKALEHTKRLIVIAMVTLGITLASQAFWILPLLSSLSHSRFVETFGREYTSTEAVRFFSFADFSHSIALLQPNWPENIFGKTYFLQPEFLVLPILAFVSLLFFKNPKSKILNPRQYQNSKFKIQKEVSKSPNLQIFFLSLLALLGAFLAKGSNPPLGQLYVWLFTHVPGFIMFRDSTKFYVFVALSYSILIPFTIEQIAKGLKRNFNIVPSLICIVVWLFTIREAMFAQLNGTFKTKQVPQEYITLKDFLVEQPEFFRTLWVPQSPRFGFYSFDHPAISLRYIFDASRVPSVINWLMKEDAEHQLARWSVRYVIVPYDSEGEIFLEDREYSERMYQIAIRELKTIPWLTPVTGFDRIAVFQVPSTKDHFWITPDKGADCEVPNIRYMRINPTKYDVDMRGCKQQGLLVFSETFDPNWTAVIDEKKIMSRATSDGLNSFPIASGDARSVIVAYEPQRFVRYGLIVSGFTLVTTVAYLLTPTVRGTIRVWQRRKRA